MGDFEQQLRGDLDAIITKQVSTHAKQEQKIAEQKQKLDDALIKRSLEQRKQRRVSSMCSRLDEHVVRGLEDVRSLLVAGVDALPVVDALVEVMLRKERMLRPPPAADPNDEPRSKKLRKSTRKNHGQPPGAIQLSFETPEKRYQTVQPIAPPPRPLNLDTTTTSYLLDADGKRTKKTEHKTLKECAKALKVFNQFQVIKRDMERKGRAQVTRHGDGAVYEIV